MHAYVLRGYTLVIRPYNCPCIAPYLGQNEFFEGWFLKALQAVLFHATAIHCHHGMDVNKASFFVLE